MPISLKNLGLDKLNVDERLALIQEIWDTISVDSPDVPLTEAQRAELDRRIADHEANPEDVIPWDEVKASVHNHLKK